jgi:hypothetical protein
MCMVGRKQCPSIVLRGVLNFPCAFIKSLDAFFCKLNLEVKNPCKVLARGLASWVLIPGRDKEIFLCSIAPNRLWFPPGLFPRCKPAEARSWPTHLHIVLRSIMVESYLHSSYVFRECCFIKHKENFTLRSISDALHKNLFGICGLYQWFPKWAVPPPGGLWEYLGGCLEVWGAGGGPLRARWSLVYDWSDLRADTEKLVSLHQAHPSH